MNQTKQNILVVSILFLSLLTSVALSYAITPTNNQAAVDKPVMKQTLKAAEPQKQSKTSLKLLLPQLVK